MGLTEEFHEVLENLHMEEDGVVHGESVLPATFSGFQGHFPERPMMPAVCQVEMARCLVEAAEGRRLRIDRVVRAKYVRPIGAEERIVLEARILDHAEGLRCKASLSVGRELKSSIDLLMSRV